MLELARMDPEQPYGGGHAVFREAVRQERLAQAQERAVADVPVRFEGLPAEYLQVDWGEIRRFPFTALAQQRHQPGHASAAQLETGTRYFLACRLKYSRWTWVRFTSDMRQETLFRGLVDCFCALGWVPWVLTFDNMKTVTTGRDAQGQAVWHPALLQLATEFGFHPEACTPGAGNQKGSVEALVKWVKGNFLAGRTFADDADLATQCSEWLVYANDRPSQATDVAPAVRLVQEATRGGRLPARAHDYGFLHVARVSAEALVPVLGNQYSVPILHVGAPVSVRVHRDRLALWRDTVLLAEHPRTPDGAHQRVVEPSHYALLFAKKPRAQLMLYREALVQLGQSARWYMSELSYRQRARLREEVTGVYALYQQYGAERLLAAMEYATERSVYGAAYLRALLELPTWPPVFPLLAPFPPLPSTFPFPLHSPPDQHAARAASAAPATEVEGSQPDQPEQPDLPPQDEVDRALHLYEQYVCVDPGTQGNDTGVLDHADRTPAVLGGLVAEAVDVAERAR